MVGIIMGSRSDLEVMREAADILKELGVTYELTVVSAHRTPERMMDYAQTARARGLKCIIAGAGGAAHLPGMVASMTSLPVIGVPVKSRNSIDGWDSLLSIVQMPSGVPVATVALNGAQNAGILAAQIIAIGDSALTAKLDAYKKALSDKVGEGIRRAQATIPEHLRQLKQVSGAPGRVHVLRLGPGDDVRGTLRSWASSLGIEAAAITSAVGSLTQAHLRHANQSDGTLTSGDLEVISLSGTLSRHGLHVHMSVADTEGRMRGGHLLDGCLVRTTLELVIQEIDGIRMLRVKDEVTGYAELDPQPI